MEGSAHTIAKRTLNTATAAANNAVAITLAAPGVGFRHVIYDLQVSYDIDPDSIPAVGGITITEDGVLVFDVDITKSGPAPLYFRDGLEFADNAAVVVTLIAGGAGVTGKSNFQSA